MAIIFLSNTLKNAVGIKNLSHELTLISNSEDLFNWNAHLFKIGRAKKVIFINKKSLYAFYTANLQKEDLLNLKEIFLRGLREQINEDFFISDKDKTELLSNYSTILLRNTDNDKKVIGTMNDYIYHVKSMYSIDYFYYSKSEKFKSSLINGMPVGTLKYHTPKEFQTEIFNKLGFDCKPKFQRKIDQVEYDLINQNKT